MGYENIIYQVDDGVATISFNRPKALNALNAALLEEFSQALDTIAADDSIRVLVLTGSGDKAFVAGADISELATYNALTAKTFSEYGHAIFARLQALPIAVIAAVNGFALGGGTEIAITCDFIYASENAKFGQPEIKLAVFAPAASCLLMISAAEAEKIGLVNKVVPAEQLMAEVMQTAREIASKGRVSLRAAKQAINHGLNTDLATGIHIEVEGFGMCYGSADAKEGTAAFLEKRKADFKGSLKD